MKELYKQVMKELRLLNGDCIDKLKELDNNSIDSIVTDPPYGLSFMGKKWDYDVPSVEIWQECLRVLKPGGHLLAFAGSRTYHRMAVRIEDAGFDIRDQIMWIYGSGFPKSHNVGKSIDKMQGNQRQVVDTKEQSGAKFKEWSNDPNETRWHNQGFNKVDGREFDITKGNSIGEGWGTALKPAHEPIVMARKPIEGTVAENTLQYGVGGLNIDATRVGSEMVSTHSNVNSEPREGRWPANVIINEEGDQEWKRYFYCPKASKKDRDSGMPEKVGVFIQRPRREDGSVIYKETNPDEWAEAMKGKPRSEKTAKAAAEELLQDDKTATRNVHPTVKPTELMKYLIRLVTPKDGIVLDPFMGSGSTGKAAMQEGMWFVGIEREREYFEIAKQRIEYEADKRKFW